ncbi:YrdB family protein [Puia sp.]|jgi:hypothetical protein|uniref:YrdB family protein n=1 Tax=Puia sp. TaxID=2045100 RepID=UPI002F426EAD
MKTVLQFNLVVLFFMELGMLTALGYWGFHTHTGAPAWLWGIGLPLAVAFLWGIWAAPRSSRRLGMPYRAIFATVLFGLAAFLWSRAGQEKYAIIFFIVSVISMLTGYLSES